MIKQHIRRIYHRWYHPGVRIGSGCFIDRKSKVDRSVFIGDHTSIFSSSIRGTTTIHNKCVIGRNCRIGSSILSNNIQTDSSVEIYGSELSKNIRIQTACYFADVKIGSYSYIGRESYLNQVTTGSFVSIGPRCMIGLGDHPTSFPSTSPAFYSTLGQCGATFATDTIFEERRSISIGNDVWIGAGVFIKDGMTIGNGAVIAAGAVVIHDVPPYAIVGGVPGKILKYRFENDTIDKLQKLKWWDWNSQRLKSNVSLFQQSNIHEFISRLEESS